MYKKKKQKRIENKYFYAGICIIAIILVCLFLISAYVLNALENVKQEANEVNKKKNEVSQKEEKENYYKPQISIEIPNEYKDDFINACDSCGIDVECISNFQKIDNWQYGENFSFIYNGGYYTICFSNSGEVVSISDCTSEKIYENADVELIENESEEVEIPEETPNEAREVEENKKNIYNPDDNIERLITEYNQISEFKIGENNIRQGAYDFNACASCNGVWIMIYDSTKMYVDFSIDAYDDSRIYPIFRDFCKVLNKNLTDEEILAGWSELQTGKYKAYNYFCLGGIQCSYSGFRPEIGAMTQYTIKIGVEY